MLTTLCRRRGVLFYLFSCLLLLLYAFLIELDSHALSRNAVAYDEYECGCPRFGPPLGGSDSVSLCSDWSSSRGHGQKVVTYSVYGDIRRRQVKKQYYSEIEDRAKEVARLYSGWVMRLYHNTSRSQRETSDLLCDLFCRYTHLDLCLVTHLFPPLFLTAQDRQKKKNNLLEHEEKLGLHSHRNMNASFEKRLMGKMWRFIAMSDPVVSEFLVRDVDSAILPREVAAVEQWRANSTALIHVMRDHPSHNGLILAGMWGGSRERGAANLTKMLAAMMRWPPRNFWDYDQMLLKRVVWPEVLDTVLAHDSYFCVNPHFQSRHRSVPFPTRRDGFFFVGWGPARGEEQRSIIDCPVQCRPPDHPDWSHC